MMFIIYSIKLDYFRTMVNLLFREIASVRHLPVMVLILDCVREEPIWNLTLVLIDHRATFVTQTQHLQ